MRFNVSAVAIILLITDFIGSSKHVHNSIKINNNAYSDGELNTTSNDTDIVLISVSI
jgi:hypothetical protein